VSRMNPIYDLAGNAAVASISGLQVDLTPPTVSQSINAPAATGWYNLSTGPAIVTYTASDKLSGVVSIPAPATLGQRAHQSMPRPTVTDVAGTVSAPTAGYSGINVDLQKPTVSAAPTTAPNANGWYNGPVTVHYTAVDNLSGVTAPADVVLT